MTPNLSFAVGVASLAIAGVVPTTLLGQTTGPGPYYAAPSWSQKLQCDTQATCPRFLVLSNWFSTAVLDRETGLVWERFPRSDRFNWAEASEICINADVGRRSGWRLPTIQELKSLVDTSQITPALPPGHPFVNVFFDLAFGAYWSATTFAAVNTPDHGSTSSVWIINYHDGRAVTRPRFESLDFHVWCVRGGEGVDPQ